MKKDDLFIKDDIAIPIHELEFSASKSGGPGGQHVNKTSSRITVRWNIANTTALNDTQKKQVMDKLQSELTSDGDLLVHNSSSRSQAQNKKNALNVLAEKVRTALYVPKKRMKTRVPKKKKEKRLQEKKRLSEIKKLRSKKDW